MGDLLGDGRIGGVGGEGGKREAVVGGVVGAEARDVAEGLDDLAVTAEGASLGVEAGEDGGGVHERQCTGGKSAVPTGAGACVSAKMGTA